jgi:hypothetical protein
MRLPTGPQPHQLVSMAPRLRPHSPALWVTSHNALPLNSALLAQSGPDLEGSAVAAALCERVQLPEERDVQRAVLVERVPIVHEGSYSAAG